MAQLIVYSCMLGQNTFLPSFEEEFDFGKLLDDCNAAFIFAGPGELRSTFEVPLNEMRPWLRSFGFMTDDQMRSQLANQARRREKRVVDRTVVVRHRDTKMPTWDGTTAALVFDPVTWYFDPDSRRQEIRLQDSAVGPKKTLDARSSREEFIPRRTFLEYLIERPPQLPRIEIEHGIRMPLPSVQASHSSQPSPASP
jgi:hypothetical protein